MRRIYLYNHKKQGVSLLIYGESVHYLKNVLRLKEGSQFRAFDGTAEYLLQIEKIQPSIKAKILEMTQTYQKEPAVRIEFCPALCKMKVFECMLEKAAELGVAIIKPTITSRSFYIPKERLSSKIERWRKILAEGSKISGRTKIPEICVPEAIDKIMDETGIKIFFWEQSEKNLKEIIPLIKQQISKEKTIKVFIGSEGGFTEEEAELAVKTNSFIAGLGKRILKVETAATTAISILLYEFDTI